MSPQRVMYGTPEPRGSLNGPNRVDEPFLWVLPPHAHINGQQRGRRIRYIAQPDPYHVDSVAASKFSTFMCMHSALRKLCSTSNSAQFL